MRRSLCATLVGLSVAMALLCPVASGALQFELTEIDLPSGVSSININGMAETSTAFTAYGAYNTWYCSGSWTTLGQGNVVGYSECASTTGYVGGYRSSTARGWLVTGVSATSADLPVASSGSVKAYGVNDFGLFTGSTDVADPPFGRKAWVCDWPAGKAVTYLPFYNVTGDESKLADLMVGRAVNDAGTVVGIAREGEQAWDAFQWTASGGVQSLGMQITGYSAQLDVFDISSSGMIAGQVNGKVFVKDINQAGYTNTDIPGASYMKGGVNDAGMLVASGSVYHAGQTDSIQSLLIDSLGYSSFTLIDIDNRGRIIAEAWGGSHSMSHVPVMLSPVTGPNVVANATFDTDAGLSFGGAGTGQVVTDPSNGGNLCVELATGSPTYVEQLVDTPNGTFEVAFDYNVLDAGSTIELTLNGTTLATLGPLAPTSGWVNDGLLVSDASLFDLTGAALRITVDNAQSGQRVLLDNLEIRVVDEIPEPATLALLACGAGWMIRRKRAKVAA